MEGEILIADSDLGPPAATTPEHELYGGAGAQELPAVALALEVSAVDVPKQIQKYVALQKRSLAALKKLRPDQVQVHLVYQLASQNVYKYI